ncbi:VPLPA-CTERM sorting domain-containing protein [Tropicibacter sp. S64]|uniref:VPLPA-CTERM sorting domain-containing protein n=1 Tax=Tropicibacter sp. S64 TaxID=3415122 RepID=UPI003C7C1ABA
MTRLSFMIPVLLVTASAAQSETVTFDYSLNLTRTVVDVTPGSGTSSTSGLFPLALDAFDSGLGALNFARITVHVDYAMTWMLDDAGTGASGTSFASLTTGFDGFTIIANTQTVSVSCNASTFSPPTCPQSDTLDFHRTGTRTYSAAAWDTAYAASNMLTGQFSLSSTLTSGSRLSTMIDTAYDAPVFSGFNDGIWSAVLTYDYTPSQVPLPAAGGLLLAGLGGIAALRRRRG